MYGLVYEPNLWKKFKERRKELKYSRRELSEKTGICADTIEDIENGVSNTSLSRINIIAKALEMRVEIRAWKN